MSVDMYMHIYIHIYIYIYIYLKIENLQVRFDTFGLAVGKSTE